MDVPTPEQADRLLADAGQRNPGNWVRHARHVARAAAAIAARHPDLHHETAYALGCLHDIGRREGVTQMRHVVDGYRFLAARAHSGAARVALTHSFPLQDVNAVFGVWDCPAEDVAFVRDFLDRTEYDDYDRLVQLCDALALPSGFCLIEKRLVDVALRYGPNEYAVPKWRAVFAIRDRVEAAIGCSIYSLLPGVVENTFGCNPRVEGSAA